MKEKIKNNLLKLLLILGPGFITLTADNDAGAVSTYIQAGAQYGPGLLWLILLLIPITYFVQEMCCRLGIATGEGQASLIYKKFGKLWGAISLGDLLFVNFLTILTEFAAIGMAFTHVGVPPYISVPIAMLGLIWLMASGSYLRWERIMIFLCVLNIGWFALMVHVMNTPVATHVKALPANNYLFLCMAIIGTTIAPWQLFFQQSCVIDKKIGLHDLKFARLETFLGTLFAMLASGAMIFIGMAAYNHGIPFTDPAQMASQLFNVYGPMFKYGILLLMVNASIIGASTISLSSAWAYGEVKGWPHSLHKKIKDAPAFYAMYFIGIVLAGGIVMIPKVPLELVIVGVQVLAGVMLPYSLVMLQIMLNDKKIVGEKFVNKAMNNWINWIVISILCLLSFVLVLQVFIPKLFK